MEVNYPSWKRVRDWMAAVEPIGRVPAKPNWKRREPLHGMKSTHDFIEFLRTYLIVMKKVFQNGFVASPNFLWTQDYSVSEKTAAAVQNQDSELQLNFIESKYGGHIIGGTFSTYIELFQRAAERLLLALPSVAPRSKRPSLLRQQAKEVIESSVFGVFIPADAKTVDAQLLAWATQNGILQQAVLPETFRVLYCTHPLNSRNDSSQRDKVYHLLRQCVLLHEHFHAILEAGIAANGQTAIGPVDKMNWSKVVPLNESLAVWMELHFVRKHGHLVGSPEEVDEVSRALWAYIKSSDYPNWPYSGAEWIEELYNREQGISNIRTLIQQLRDNPVKAHQEFDKAIDTYRIK
jgi:hypothetical protein